MIVNHLENGVTEYITETAIVRIHPGKISDEELRARMEEACINFYKAIRKAGKEQEIRCSTQMIQ